MPTVSGDTGPGPTTGATPYTGPGMSDFDRPDASGGTADGYAIETIGYQVTEVRGETWTYVRRQSGPTNDALDQAQEWVSGALGLSSNMKGWVEEQGDPVGGNAYTEIEGIERKIVKGECANRIYGDQWDWLFGGEFKHVVGLSECLVGGGKVETILGGGVVQTVLGLLDFQLVAAALKVELCFSAWKIEKEKHGKLNFKKKAVNVTATDEKLVALKNEITASEMSTTATTSYKLVSPDYMVTCNKGALKAVTTLDVAGADGVKIAGKKVTVSAGAVAPAPMPASLEMDGANAKLVCGTQLTLQGGAGAIVVTAAETKIGSTMTIKHTAPQTPVLKPGPAHPLTMMQTALTRAGIEMTLITGGA